MPKFYSVVIVLIAVLLLAAQGFPVRDEEISAAAAAGNWDEVQRLLKEHAKETFTWAPMLAAEIRDLKPVRGGHVYGESEFIFQSSSNLNGKVDTDSGGHRLVNNDGSVTEYYFKP